MLALNGIYQNGTVTLERPLPINKSMKVIVTFVEDDFSEYAEIMETYFKPKHETKTKGTDLNRFSFLKSIDASKDFKGSFGDAVIEERRSEV